MAEGKETMTRQEKIRKGRRERREGEEGEVKK